ncbi:MAG: alkane 1-monooxygenase [Pseudomonadota bacterium]
MATLLPVPMLVAAAFLGGVWIALACVYLSVFVLLLDRLAGRAAETAAPGVEFPAGRWLSAVLGMAHFPVFLLGVAALAGATGLGSVERAGLFLCFGLYLGQVLFSNAHELIHCRRPSSFWLGALVYASAFYGHHVTAHRFIHHRFVASPRDPNSAPLGQGFWAFAGKAWIGAFLAGLAVERARLRRARGQSAMRLFPPAYMAYIAMPALAAFGIGLWLGLPGIAAYIALSAYACLQILLADYVQHYGLQRDIRPDGSLAPVSIAHSWNAPHRFSAALMLNAPRHSDHHMNPLKPFTSLEIPAEHAAPMLPASLPAMSSLALIPPLWRRVMDKRARAWHRTGAALPIAAE